MDRIIGIDYGRKRVGVAVSDPLGIFASALETVQSAKIIEYLKKYAENENVVRFVVGYPVNMDGALSEAAQDAMIDGGMKAKDRRDKESVDKISAAIILQSYMDKSSGPKGMAFDPMMVPDSMSSKVTRKKRR